MGEKLEKMRRTVRMTIELLRRKPLEALINQFSLGKNAQEFMEYQRVEHGISRILRNDRVFPFETVTLLHYNDKHGSDIEQAVIHTGPYANELTRSMHAMALAIGDDIYFRDNAYRPESEEGRKLLTHELTHVAQHREKRVEGNISREALEREAEQAERQTGYDPDPYELYPVENKVYRIRRSQIRQVTRMAADGVEEWLRGQGKVCGGEEYVRLLSAYDEWVEEEGW